jgi:ABC-2 type transport system permease protein
MKQLLSIEYSKLRKLVSIKAIFIIYMAIVPLWLIFMGNFISNLNLSILPKKEVLWSFPAIWQLATYCSSFFNVLLGVIVVLITCNEITFRTMRQNVIDGLTKKQVIFSKFLVILFLSLLVTLYTALVALVFGLLFSDISGAYENIHFVSIYFLQTLGYFSFAFFFAVLVKRPALSIIFFILSFPIETIAGAFLPKAIYAFFPLNAFSSLTPIPFFDAILKSRSPDAVVFNMPLWGEISLACFYTAVFFIIAYTVLKKRDL